MTVLCVGKLKEKFYLEAAAEYVKRFQRFCKLELVELPESRLPESPSPAEVQRALAAEAAAIRERLPKGGAVIALCIEGKPCSSVELSRRMEELAVAGKTQLTFLIGGSVGLDESLKRFETVFPACGSSNSAIELTIPELEANCDHFQGWVDVCKIPEE